MTSLTVCFFLYHLCFFFFFNDTATTEIYTLSLHDALPISPVPVAAPRSFWPARSSPAPSPIRSEEHTSELQSLAYLVCRLLLEKKEIYQYGEFYIRIFTNPSNCFPHLLKR